MEYPTSSNAPIPPMETGRQLNPSHFLALPRPSLTSSSSPPLFLDDAPLDSPPLVDTTTLAAHDFDVDPRTGFMPPQPPLARLPSPLEEHHHYELWEQVLENACAARLQFSDKCGGLTEEEEARSERWREQVRNLPVIAITPLLRSEILLRRAHHVLAWIMHFYIFTFPLSSSDLRIPAPITLPLLQVSRELQLPPVLTYSDTVLYNWTVTDATAQSSSSTGAIDPQKLRALTTFTSTPDEEHFFLTSARIELIGVRALACMQSTLDELFVGDSIAVRRITQYLQKLGGGSDSAPSLPSSRGVIGEMELELGNMTAGCDPRLFYEVIRPWFRGIDSNNLKPGERRWIFEGIEMDQMLEEPTELSGASAGQSSIIHALDVFLGVQQYSHSGNLTGQGASRQSQSQSEKASFLARMQLYMPRHHRNFLNHLRNQARSLRAFVLDTLTAAGLSFDDSAMPIVSPSSSSFSASSSTSFADTMDPNDALELLHAYNAAVVALKKLRDCHIVIVARYIIGPAAHSRMAQDKDKGKGKEEATEDSLDGPLKGTGGTDLVQFLKGVRDGTRDAVIPVVPL